MLESFDSVIGDYADGTVVHYKPVNVQIIGQTEEELRDVSVTQLEYWPDDFDKPIKASFRITLANKEVFDNNVAFLADLAPMFLAVEMHPAHDGITITGMKLAQNIELRARLLTNYLLLPFYLTVHEKPKLYGLEHGMLSADYDYSVGGKIMARKLQIAYLIAGGKRFHCGPWKQDLRSFFKHHMYRRAAQNMNAMLMDADTAKTLESPYEV